MYCMLISAKGTVGGESEGIIATKKLAHLIGCMELAMLSVLALVVSSAPYKSTIPVPTVVRKRTRSAMFQPTHIALSISPMGPSVRDGITERELPSGRSNSKSHTDFPSSPKRESEFMTTLAFLNMETPLLSGTWINASVRDRITECTFRSSPKLRSEFLASLVSDLLTPLLVPNGLASGSKSGGVIIGAYVGGSLAVMGVGVAVAVVNWRKTPEEDDGDANDMLPRQLL
jgi:hypothetical protein